LSKGSNEEQVFSPSVSPGAAMIAGMRKLPIFDDNLRLPCLLQRQCHRGSAAPAKLGLGGLSAP
jgi:hypothetical protein